MYLVLGVTFSNSFGSVFGEDDSALEGYIYIYPDGGKA
jgi:hypothetical protein